MGKAYDKDVVQLAQDAAIPWDALEGKVVVITGSTGLLGGLIARAILAHNQTTRRSISLVLPVRNIRKAEALYDGSDDLRLIPWDAALGHAPSLEACDYIVHCASNTDSRLMVEDPIGTINTTVQGTSAMLELAHSTGARMCFVSSMEVYGAGQDRPLDERCGGALDAMSVRSSYPQAKQLAETLCAAYASQYGAAVCVARLSQSFGPGISPQDRRVFAEFARCCLNNRNIELLTDGSKRNMYVYTADAVRALLTLVVRGKAGEAYNIANEKTYCSVYEMAQMVAQRFGHGIEVRRKVDPAAAARYAVSGSIYLDTSKIRSLGWTATVDLYHMYARMMDDWAGSDTGVCPTTR